MPVTTPRSANTRRGEGKPFDVDLTKETLAKVLDGELFWDQHVHRADDMVTAIRLADEFGYKLVINHGTEGHLIADLLAERGIPVILGPLFTSRSKVELRHRTLRSAGILTRAGVKIAITTDHPVIPINFLVYQAALAVKDGLDPENALRALTVNPAAMLNLDDKVGSLKAGLDADVVIWSGDPLDVMNRATRVFVRGQEVYHFDEAKGVGVVEERRYREA
jgi:imidazolonepropionase-like amidohydrolase